MPETTTQVIVFSWETHTSAWYLEAAWLATAAIAGYSCYESMVGRIDRLFELDSCGVSQLENRFDQ